MPDAEMLKDVDSIKSEALFEDLKILNGSRE